MSEIDEIAALRAELREARHERDGETRRADVAQEANAIAHRTPPPLDAPAVAGEKEHATLLLRLHGFTDPYGAIWQSDALVWLARSPLRSIANYTRQHANPADMELAALKFLRWRMDRAIEAAEEACKQAQLAADRENNN